MDARLDMSRSEAASCPYCQAALVQTACGELCTACLFAAALRPAERIGPYDIDQPIDEGGTGVVYVASEPDQEGMLAIKIARPELCGDVAALQAFRSGMSIQQSLRDQANIVAIYRIDTHTDGRPYAVMPMLEGGTLADASVRARYQQPEAASALLVKLATAIGAAHQRGILHCDLKPANILFNAEGEAFLSDFGMARVVGGGETRHGPAFCGGTPGWMSPEQTTQGDLTIASDVFALGVLLYWLLSGELPFGSGADFCRRVAKGPHPLPSASNQLLSDLGRICARALCSAPEGRYRSAAEFVDDVERARRGDPLEADLRHPVRRTLRWARRHKLEALVLTEVLLLLLYLPLMPLSVLSDVKGTLQSQLRFAASAQAGAVLNELRASADRLAQLAEEPAIKALVDWPRPSEPPPELVSYATGFDGLSVFSPLGILSARWPTPRYPHPTYDFSFRDYYRGAHRNAQEGRGGVYVARPYHAAGDEVPALGLSTALYRDQKQIGYLLGSTKARSTFGAVQMNCAQGSCMTALLGPRDRNYDEAQMPRSIFVLAAPGLRDGQEEMLDTLTSERLCAHFDCQPAASNQFAPPRRSNPMMLDDYRDPISATRSMAAVAPVARTGLFVVVATPLDALDALMSRIADRLKAFLWVPLLAGLLVFGAATTWPTWLARRQRRAHRT